MRMALAGDLVFSGDGNGNGNNDMGLAVALFFFFLLLSFHTAGWLVGGSGGARSIHPLSLASPHLVSSRVGWACSSSGSLACQRAFGLADTTARMGMGCEGARAPGMWFLYTPLPAIAAPLGGGGVGDPICVGSLPMLAPWSSAVLAGGGGLLRALRAGEDCVGGCGGGCEREREKERERRRRMRRRRSGRKE
ncbi:uncharacterized protein K452DRAFT_151937 [Aplosporella prunicola CBS 121167]|uniref:Uncharacterized protein n=1 Tax=Aplosporella prunicola CBS 121167 TaxID=1176127 RepID=A0A6A6BIT7_9PEZI|nr:uncharacterized protein K452DRAFT_151937 [Aplosporella prunicola CBS 121167]KAF2144039.1 hypothetical protein K452DRAFT_151937 [Aplosporella prunicola CBS 121167]